MKKQYGRMIVCTLLMGTCILSAANAADETGNLTPQGAKAYLEVIQSQQNAYGTATVPSYSLWKGLSLTRLIDFDGDGIPELYCGAGLDGQSLYTFDGQIQNLNIPQRVSNFGTDVSPCTQFYVDAEKAYLVDGHEVMNGGSVTYYTKSGNAMTATLTYTNEYEKDCTLNGQVVTDEVLNQQISALTAGMAEQYYTYWGNMDNSVPEDSVAETIAALRLLTNPTASPSSLKVTINGVSVPLAAYAMNGNNYFKLRDLGKALDFNVTWDGSTTISIDTSAAYTE